MSTMFFSDKDPDEVLVLSVDFVDVLEAGETISSASWLIVRENSDEDTSGMLSGTIDSSGSPIIRQKVQGGNDGATYIHRCKVVTSSGRTLVAGVFQAVRYGA